MTINGNIFCVGRNYLAHVNELKNKVPTKPFFFMKPSHSLIKTSSSPVVNLPRGKGSIHYETELVIEMRNDFDTELPLEEMISNVYVGIDFTLRDLQNELRKNDLPWLASKGFENSAVLSEPTPFANYQTFEKTNFALEINQNIVQSTTPESMIFHLPELMRACSDAIGLKKGDLLFTGTPEGVGETYNNDHFELFLNNQSVGFFDVQI